MYDVINLHDLLFPPFLWHQSSSSFFKNFYILVIIIIVENDPLISQTMTVKSFNNSVTSQGSVTDSQSLNMLTMIRNLLVAILIVLVILVILLLIQLLMPDHNTTIINLQEERKNQSKSIIEDQ